MPTTRDTITAIIVQYLNAHHIPAEIDTAWPNWTHSIRPIKVRGPLITPMDIFIRRETVAIR